MPDFDREIKFTYLEEAAQLLADAERCFLALESSPYNPGLLDTVLRHAHNLKGGANAVGFSDLGVFMHQLESLLLKLKKSGLPVPRASASLLLRCHDHVFRMLQELRADFHSRTDSTELLRALEIHRVDLKQTSAAHGPEASIIVPIIDPGMRVNPAHVDELASSVQELIDLQEVLREQTRSGGTALRKTVQKMSKAARTLLELSDNLKKTSLSRTFQQISRIARDLSASLAKPVNLTLTGGETQLDRVTLEALHAPLAHLIRNAIDHGIESAHVRVKNGKPEAGRISIHAGQRGGTLVIEIQDDGGGLDSRKLLKAAVEKGFVKAGTILSEQETYALIFRPGFSTKSKVSEISGRGIGMDIVFTQVASLQGEIEVQAKLGKGTLFRISVPLAVTVPKRNAA
jgi:two-component system chemotaxis sensor kinase CheA